MCIWASGATEVLNFPTHIPLNNHPMIGIISPVIGYNADYYRPFHERRSDLVNHPASRAGSFLPAFYNYLALLIDMINQLASLQGIKVREQLGSVRNGGCLKGKGALDNRHVNVGRVNLFAIPLKERLHVLSKPSKIAQANTIRTHVGVLRLTV